MKKIILITLSLLFFTVFAAHAEITKISEIGAIDVQANGVLNVHLVTTVLEDGRIISKQDNMTQFVPGQDVTSEARKIKDMAATVWTETVIARYEAAQNGTPLTLDQQKVIKTKMLYQNIKNFINTLPNGIPRYDADLKLTLMNAAMTAMAAGQPKPQAVKAAETWLYTVQGVFVAKKTTIRAAKDQAALDAIDVSIDTLESQYGRSGSVLVDPGISTTDLVAK